MQKVSLESKKNRFSQRSDSIFFYVSDQRETFVEVNSDNFASPVRIKLADNEDMWEGFDRLRVLNYPECHIILLCFSLGNPQSLEDIEQKWIPEATHHCPTKPMFLVGTKTDLLETSEKVWEILFIAHFLLDEETHLYPNFCDGLFCRRASCSSARRRKD